jgi:hypothetical protein
MSTRGAKILGWRQETPDPSPRVQRERAMDESVAESSALRQIETMKVAFGQAAESFPASLSESWHTFGGMSVRIRIVGRALAEGILQPISHLKAEGLDRVAPQLAIDLWDEEETGIRRQIRSPQQSGQWSQITATSTEGRFVLHQLPNTLVALDLEANHIVGSIAWSDRIFIYERAKPLARPLLEWHNRRNVQVIHAGLVSQDSRGILLAGKSGSGKSSAALACLCAGLSFLSEDFVGLEQLPDGSFRGHSIYNSVFLETEHLGRFSALAPLVIRIRLPKERKSAIILSQAFPERLACSVPIRAVALCRVGDAPGSRLGPASKGEALLGLGASSLLQIPSREKRIFLKLADLIEQIPCYRLELGRDLHSIPGRVQEILAEVAQS